MAGGRPLAFDTVDDLEQAIESYFDREEGDAWIDMGEGQKMYAPTMSGLARHLGVDRKTITNYGQKEEYFPTIKKARAMVEEALEKRLYGNNVTGVIFNLKNNFGWCDKQEVVSTNIEMSHEDWLDSLE